MYKEYEYECPNCGEGTEEPGTCHYCGCEIDEDSIFCRSMSDEELYEDDL